MEEELNRILESGPQIPAALAEQIRSQIRRDTAAVRPLLPPAVYVVLFSGIAVAVAILFALFKGFGGLVVLPLSTALEMLIVLVAFAIFGGAMQSRAMRPGSGSLNNWLLGGIALAAYEALVLGLFRDYSTGAFVHQGLACLALGVSCGAVAAIPMWLLLRRGLVVEPIRAGALTGLLGGLAGVIALTLHCQVVTTPHAGVWHAGVIVFCILAGAGMGRFSRFETRRP